MKNWTVREEISVEAKNDLASYPELVRHLLYHRGLDNSIDAEKFLNPTYADLHDPFLIMNMDKAVGRILTAMQKSEKILIYGDYDCDGIPGSVVLHDFFKKVGYKDVSVYIPHRYKEGYGLNIPAIEKFAADGVNLIITVDTGIVDVLPVDRANQLGIDVIITDHHLPQEKIPAAYTILNSKQEDDKYPFDMLCGAGVAFKLVQALIKKGNFNLSDGWEKWLLDAVGLSTIADLVPLNGENRILATCGLKVLRKTRRPGLLSLFYKTRVSQPNLNEDDIGFTIAPHINAASRMGDPIEGFKFLSTEDDIEAKTLADYLNDKNSERKKAVSSMVKEAEDCLDPNSKEQVIVVGNQKWLPGIVGLAANKISEKYKKVAFVWGKEGSAQVRGSCRSDGFINIVDLMQTVGKDFFIDFGGHALAGGFSLIENQISKLQEKLNEAYKMLCDVKEKDDQEQIIVDKKLLLNDANWQMYSQIEKLAPFGVGNPKPVFLFEGIEVFNARRFGENQDHVALDFKKSDGSMISAIAFGVTPNSFEEGIFEPNRLIDLVATFEKSYFRNRPELRLRIVDARHAF